MRNTKDRVSPQFQTPVLLTNFDVFEICIAKHGLECLIHLLKAVSLSMKSCRNYCSIVAPFDMK